MSTLNALIKCSIDCPSMCNWPINVQCPQCLPQCMLYEIGFDLIKWKIEGLLSRSMDFLCQINVFESFLNPFVNILFPTFQCDNGILNDAQLLKIRCNNCGKLTCFKCKKPVRKLSYLKIDKYLYHGDIEFSNLCLSKSRWRMIYQQIYSKKKKKNLS